MPRIFDNIEQQLLPALTDTLKVSERADFCVGYFNLRGWKAIDDFIERWSGGDGNCCRLLVGMQKPPQEELREALSLSKTDGGLDNQTASRLKKRLAQEFRDQLCIGVPTNEDEAGLRRLASQIKSKKVKIKLFLRHPLHAKLYLLFRPDPVNPSIGFLGSSNLTFAGLSKQGELNIDVLDHDACQKLAKWFEDRWNDRWCMDISDELLKIIEESWAREDLIPPYHIYIKIAYHLSREAREGLREFQIPKVFNDELFDFQVAAVKIAAHHLNKRSGVLIGDVVGLGKTLMATALARIFEDDYGIETLIISPKNLVRMWEDYRARYSLRGKVLSLSRVIDELPELRRYQLVLIDESHNLRNREGKRYRIIEEYIRKNASKCILLSATPYNKTYIDLSNQLRLFVPEDQDLGIRPERLLREISLDEFIRRHQCQPKTLAAFEKSEYPDDWQELMRLYLVRRTRTFIQQNYAKTDPDNDRKYLIFEDGSRSYFPTRKPCTLKFKINDKDASDQYARLYSPGVVNAVGSLNLPRYGLANYIPATPHKPPTQAEAKQLQDLSRAGKRLMGFCRVNLFKRLESGGLAFLQSVERHVLRNYVFLHAIENGLEIPIGTQGAEMLDSRFYDEDIEAPDKVVDLFDGDDAEETEAGADIETVCAEDAFKKCAEDIYKDYSTKYRRYFKWLSSKLFVKSLAKDLESDADLLFGILKKCKDWDPAKDAKLKVLFDLLTKKHPEEKVIIFTQFADTVRYLVKELQFKGIDKIAGVTGDTSDPTATAWRFSPKSNKRFIPLEEQFRILVTTDILSEGQNLQDASIVVNYDLPWAIIRLVQRAGRVDRIGQNDEFIRCYSFLPADGVERIIRLRARVRQRLQTNAEVIGADEAFFEDDADTQAVVDLYNEKAGILDGDAESDVDLASYAYQIWKNAVDKEPRLKKLIPELPNVVYSAKAHKSAQDKPAGALVYMKTNQDNDALVWMDNKENSVTESQFAVLKAAECGPDTPAVSRSENHHDLVRKAVTLVAEEEKSVGGQLGGPRSARFRAYERLKSYAEQVKGEIFDTDELRNAIDDIYKYPLRALARDAINRQLRSGVSDQALAEMVIELRKESRLSNIPENEDVKAPGPQIICSMGLISE